MRSDEIRIGTRGSLLALWQANWVKERLVKAHSRLTVTLVTIKTTGDKFTDVPLAKIGGKGLFVKEIEEALLDQRIDVAVHSMKDVPTEFPPGLHLSVITEREDPRDVFLSRDQTPLKDLPKGAKIGTSSLRRQAQLLHFRPDFEMVPLRGNLQTRLKKFDALKLAGIVLALAGVRRMGLEEKITEVLPVEISLPAIGQGALGVETRTDDAVTEGYLHFLSDPDSTITVSAERAFLKRLEGGCQVPIAAYGTRKGPTLQLDGVVGTIDGRRLIKHRLEGPIEKAESLGVELAEILLNQGGREILAEVYGKSVPTVSIP